MDQPTDPDARITRLEGGRTGLAYKPEHTVDLDTGAIVAVGIHPADRDVLRDPIVRAVMRGDGVSPIEIRRVLKAGRRIQGH